MKATTPNSLSKSAQNRDRQIQTLRSTIIREASYRFTPDALPLNEDLDCLLPEGTFDDTLQKHLGSYDPVTGE